MKAHKLTAFAGTASSAKAEILVVPVFENDFNTGPVAGLLAVSDNSFAAQAKVEEFVGKAGQSMLQFTAGKTSADRTIYVGLGSKEKLTAKVLRDSLNVAFKSAIAKNVTTVALAQPDLSGSEITADEFGQIAGETAITADYVINHFKTTVGGHKAKKRLDAFTVVAASNEGTPSAGMQEGFVVGTAVNKAKDLVNLPPNYLTPTLLAEQALEVAQESGGAIKIKVYRRPALKKMGAGAFLAVAQGSDEEPVLIELSYEPEGADKSVLVGLIGKSVTYDSGGLDIKTGGSMRTMKCDMAGGATTLAAIKAIAALKLNVRVKVVMAATENMTGGSAYKSGDVLTAMNGMTIEVDNTDAEGRLTLADAIEFAKRKGVTHIVDVATLTGAMRVALGTVATGAFSNNRELTDMVLSAADTVGERVHEMPMYDEYAKANESNIADIKNSGGAAFGAGSITAAWFLRKFAGETPWVHLDVAGTAFNNNEASGWGVRTLVQLVRDFANKDAKVPGNRVTCAR